MKNSTIRTQATKKQNLKKKVYMLLGFTLIGTTAMLATTSKAQANSYYKVSVNGKCCTYCQPAHPKGPFFVW